MAVASILGIFPQAIQAAEIRNKEVCNLLQSEYDRLVVKMGPYKWVEAITSKVVKRPPWQDVDYRQHMTLIRRTFTRLNEGPDEHSPSAEAEVWNRIGIDTIQAFSSGRFEMQTSFIEGDEIYRISHLVHDHGTDYLGWYYVYASSETTLQNSYPAILTFGGNETDEILFVKDLAIFIELPGTVWRLNHLDAYSSKSTMDYLCLLGRSKSEQRWVR
jgi:hypothetical protein